MRSGGSSGVGWADGKTIVREVNGRRWEYGDCRLGLENGKRERIVGGRRNKIFWSVIRIVVRLTQIRRGIVERGQTSSTTRTARNHEIGVWRNVKNNDLVVTSTTTEKFVKIRIIKRISGHDDNAEIILRNRR